jgi:hypothetical protein
LGSEALLFVHAWWVAAVFPDFPRVFHGFASLICYSDEFMITIVSGLPRSGTSLMMQMLVAGGMTPLSDGERSADTDNPARISGRGTDPAVFQRSGLQCSS